MSLNEESPSQSQNEGEEIQQIGYDTYSDVSVSEDNNRHYNQRDKENVIYRNNKEKITQDIRKKGKNATEKNTDDTASSSSSSYDICRICHMGNPASNRACLTSNSQSQQDITTRRTIGVTSSSVNFDLGLLVSACRCRGTVGLVHTKCLERWLTESGHTHCELCGYRYATIRVPRHGLVRSFLIWIRTFVATRQMLLDSLYLVVTTPLAVFSAYVCAMTLKMALENRVNEIPWTIVAMLPTCSLTLVAYWGWLLTLQRLHGRRWRQYWQSNFVVRLVPGDDPDRTATSRSVDDVEERRDDAYDDLPDIFNLI